jgi:DNA-binding CsgD family transcriptional regulator
MSAAQGSKLAVSRILAKLGVQRRSQAASEAQRLHLV